MLLASKPEMMWRHLYSGLLECPYCGSHDVRRSRRRGGFETLLLWVLRLRAYRCRFCYERFFEYAGAVRVKPSWDEKEAA
ncbi:MAG TPA: hypothetical protein VMS96_04925 [Terriglobales bacterium]|nr:hypothetical protein [Terriglobales bacterium]